MEYTPERVARYVNGLRFDIQDELGLLSLRSVEEAYQVSLKAEEKLMRKHSKKEKMRGSGGREQQQKDETSSSNEKIQFDMNNDNRGGRNASRGRGRGGQVRCYTCGKLGHMSWDFLENVARQRGAKIMQVEPEAPKELEVAGNYPKQGEALLLKKVISESVQRRSLFKTVCKDEGKCCKLIIDSGSTDNLVSTEMVDKLNFKKIVHPKPYIFAWIQNYHQVLMSAQCQVKFQIGSYQDEVKCDIIEMDACHVL